MKAEVRERSEDAPLLALKMEKMSQGTMAASPLEKAGKWIFPSEPLQKECSSADTLT